MSVVDVLDDRLRTTPRPVRTPAPISELQSSGEIRLLVLDDDPATCAVIQAALSNRDFIIDTVSDPMLVDSVLARKSHYHLIIMDYVIPGLDADQVFAWIRDNQPEANIVVVTGYPSVDSALSCLRARTYDYLTKPFQVAHLQRIVTRKRSPPQRLVHVATTNCPALPRLYAASTHGRETRVQRVVWQAT